MIVQKIHRYWITTLLLVLCTSSFINAQTPIYKSVDENGNVIFSDEPPTPEATPYDIPDANLSVISTVRANPRQTNRQQPNSLDTIKRTFDFISPGVDETFWGTSATLRVQLDIKPRLTSNLSIILYIDGEQVREINTNQVNINSIERGTHTVRAELVDQNGNILEQAGPRTFFMKQHSQNFGGG